METGKLNIISFGYKYGFPEKANVLFDVRFLPNPYYIEELKEMSGNDRAVAEYVMSFSESQEFVDKLEDMIFFIEEYYRRKEKREFTLAIGCTGGRHRSVTVANEIYRRLKEHAGWEVCICHRDLDRDKIRKE